MSTFPTRVRAVLAVPALLAAVLAAQPVQSTPPAAHQSAVETLPADATIDDLYAAVSVDVPGYGGSYVDEATGTLYVWVTNGSAHAVRAAQRALAHALPHVEQLGDLDVALLPARYSFAALKEWHDKLSPAALALPGAVLTDVNERTNRLLVVVENLREHGPRVEATVARLGVPPAAVVVEEGPPIVSAQTTGDPHRPLLGGLAITFTMSGGGEGGCTLGFPAQQGGLVGFVTNSHCTIERGVVRSTQYFQPGRTADGLGQRDPAFAGTEVKDPPYFTGGVCPVGRSCRYSDSALVVTPPWAPGLRGAIAHTGAGRPTWNHVNHWRIVAKGDPVVGLVVSKQGRSSGFGEAVVELGCVNSNTGGSYTILCQYYADYGSIGGDSGAAVFDRRSGTAVTLMGVNWGHNSLYSVFSPMSGIERTDELGPLSVVWNLPA